MRRLAIALAVVALGGGCLDIPGLDPGDPCNAMGVCAEGLVCQDGICVDNSAIAWQQMSPPYTDSLYDVWGAGANDVFAVGLNGRIQRCEGGSLKWADSGQTAATKNLYAVWGRSSTEVWAVGSSVVLHYDGSGWTKQEVVKSNNDPVTSFTLYDVHGDGNTVYAVGQLDYSTGVVLRYDADKKWREVAAAKPTFTGKGVFVHKGRVWVVGKAAHVLSMTKGIWDQQVLPGAKDLALSAIWGADASNIVTVGPSKTLARFDGSAWTVEDAARGSSVAHGVWGASASEFYVVGASSSVSYNSEVRSGVERCGTTCAINPVPEALRGKVMRGVWGTADGKQIYAVGETGTILRRSQ